MARKVTSKILEMLEDESLSYQCIAEMCLEAMSEDDVKLMARSNDLNDLLFPGEDDG